MRIRRRAHREPRRLEQPHGRFGDLLAVLKGAGGVVGHRQRPGRGHGRQLDPAEEFADIHRQGGDPGGALGVAGILAQHEAIILDGHPAARRRDDDGGKAPAFDLYGPGVDVSARRREAVVLAPHVVDEGPAAGLAIGQDHLIAGAVQQTRCGVADLRPQHRLGASLEEGDTALRRRRGSGRGCGHGRGPGRRKGQHGANRGPGQQRTDGPGQAGQRQRDTEASGRRQDEGQQAA